MQWVKGLAIGVIALALGACASISSSYGNSREDQKGQAYYLPKGVMQVRIVEFQGSFDITVGGPILVADREFRLHADLRNAAFADNDSQIKIDPQTQLLTSAKVKSIGRGREIVENLVRPRSGYQSGNQGQPLEIFSGLYDPSELDAASAEASKALVQYYNLKCGGFGDLSDYAFNRAMGAAGIDYGAVYDNEQTKLFDCRRYRLMGIDRPGMISLVALGPVTASTANDNVRKCERGLCYRPLVPVKIRTVIAGTYTTDDFYMFPDTSTVSYYTLPSGVFATQAYNLVFDKGVLIEADQQTQSEVLGFSLLPTKVLSAIISAPIDAIRGNRRADEPVQDEAEPYGFSNALPRSYQSNTTRLSDPLQDQTRPSGTYQPQITEPYPSGSGQPPAYDPNWPAEPSPGARIEGRIIPSPRVIRNTAPPQNAPPPNK